MLAKGLIVAGSPDGSAGGPLDPCGSHALLPVANKPILFHALEAMRGAGIEDVAIVTAARSRAAVRDAVGAGAEWGLRVSHPSVRGEGLTDALLATEDFLDGHPFVLQLGDGLLRDELAPLISELAVAGSEAMVLVHREDTRRAGARRPALAQANGHGTARPTQLIGDGVVPGPGLAIAGAQVFGPGFMEGARDLLRRARGSDELAPVLEGLRRAGARIDVRLVRGWHRYGGDPRALLDMNRTVLDELEGEGTELDLSDCEIDGRVVIHPDARVESSVIRGPAVIGAGAVVCDAYVGPYTAIGEGARVEGAEIEHSVLLAGASVLHIAGRLEASVVGRDARVFRDFALPRALRLHVGDGAEVALR